MNAYKNRYGFVSVHLEKDGEQKSRRAENGLKISRKIADFEKGGLLGHLFLRYYILQGITNKQMGGWYMTKYEAISSEMRKRIREGSYPLDQPIPDEVSLAKEFNCSRMTMKRALDILVLEGLLYRKRGHGTFILKSSIRDSQVQVESKEVMGLTRLLSTRVITSEIICLEVQFPEEEVAEHLSIDVTTPVYFIIRLRLADGEPYTLEKTYMPTHLIPGITKEVLYRSVYHYIQHSLGLTIAGAHRKIRACKPDELDQKYLGCKFDDPVLEVEHVGYLDNGVPFEYSFSRHRYDKFVITTIDMKR